ncbi:peroxiredoxin [Sphingorhabdus arenilitoris]|uniref:Thioredoxin peroxidase n=1 Tax=Sphingorhabdus arenilitoris TaxID=1490041 RepID=A0ABV8RFC6_9SPHN
MLERGTILMEDTGKNSAVLRIGDMAPNFFARSTVGQVHLSSYRGQWVIFFSHPANFTPVCTSEFVGLAKAASDFAEAGCALIGLSVDSLYSHIAWLTEIERRFGLAIDFPILEDPSMAIGRAYGMIDENSRDSAAMRSTYFIDPEGIIRAVTTYPHNVGRSVEEMLRLLRGLQKVDETGLLIPEGWDGSGRLLQPPPESLQGGNGNSDWFVYAGDSK